MSHVLSMYQLKYRIGPVAFLVYRKLDWEKIFIDLSDSSIWYLSLLYDHLSCPQIASGHIWEGVSPFFDMIFIILTIAKRTEL